MSCCQGCNWTRMLWTVWLQFNWSFEESVVKKWNWLQHWWNEMIIEEWGFFGKIPHHIDESSKMRQEWKECVVCNCQKIHTTLMIFVCAMRTSLGVVWIFWKFHTARNIHCCCILLHSSVWCGILAKNSFHSTETSVFHQCHSDQFHSFFTSWPTFTSKLQLSHSQHSHFHCANVTSSFLLHLLGLKLWIPTSTGASFILTAAEATAPILTAPTAPILTAALTALTWMMRLIGCNLIALPRGVEMTDSNATSISWCISKLFKLLSEREEWLLPLPSL